MRPKKRLASIILFLLITMVLIGAKSLFSTEEWFEQGLSDLRLENYEKAIVSFSNAIKKNPDQSESFNNRAIAWGKKGDYDRAMADYNKALEINPYSAEIYNNRGSIWFFKCRYDLAIDDYDKALGIDPTFAKAYANRGAAWFCKGKYELAISDYKKALEIDPNCAETAKQFSWIQTKHLDNGEKRFDKGQQDAVIVTNMRPRESIEVTATETGPKDQRLEILEKKHSPEIKEEQIDHPAVRKNTDGSIEMTPIIRYAIQVGAFISLKRATDLKDLLKSKGYPACHMKTFTNWENKVLHAVRIGEYADLHEAREKAAEFTKKEKMPATVRSVDKL